MAFTYDLSSDVGRVRLLIPDTVWASAIFQDEELSAFLAMETGSVRRAVALALETIGANEVMTLKVMRMLDVQTDGAKVSEALLSRAKLLRQQAATEDAEATGFAGWEIAEWAVDDFTLRTLLSR